MKRKSKNRHPDRLSDLPDEMLQHILSHLPSDEAVRSSVLSRRWRDVHKAVPVVDLVDHKKGRRRYSSMDDVKAFYRPQELLDQWISSAMSSGAEEIDVKLRYWHDSRKSLCPFASFPGDFDTRMPMSRPSTSSFVALHFAACALPTGSSICR
ncbi:hypothetical protein ACQ4PT_001307 [Festuca glaucescens]